MNRAGLWARMAIAGCLVSAAGCGGSGGHPAVQDNGACGAYFDAALGTCSAAGRPADLLAHERARFVTDCQSELALPGEGVTVDQVRACASALAAAGFSFCSASTSVTAAVPSACVFKRGALGGGAACTSSDQCVSGSCAHASDGGLTRSACGTCAPPLAVGQPCDFSSQGCPQGAVCASSTNTCEVVTMNGAGGPCGATTDCQAGLYCDATTQQCAAPKGLGAACSLSLGQCAAPLICLGTTSTCQPRSSSGAACTTSGDCASGLGCSAATGQCGTVTWATAGQPCGDLVRCEMGSCNTGTGTTGTCPGVISDGQPCSPGATDATCDVLATCEDGVCVLAGTASCR